MNISTTQIRPRFLPDPESAREWGGKGASLAKLIRQGFRVPPTAAFGHSEIKKWLESLPSYAPALQAWRRWKPDAPSLLSQLREEILKTPTPEHFDLSAATLQKLLLGIESTDKTEWPLMVRSSMSTEDGACGSLAGCFSSIKLEKITGESLWDAVRLVVASSFTESSARRMLSEGLDPQDFRAGVVIQGYLEATFAGVAFSHTGTVPIGLVAWTQGAGENLVQGTDANSKEAHQNTNVIPADLKPFWNEIWEQVGKITRRMGGPVDVEWVYDDETLWIVQARAVTTEEAKLIREMPSRTWTREITQERFPDPLTPLGWTSLQNALATNLTTLSRRFGIHVKNPREMSVCIRGIVYSDPNFFKFPKGVRLSLVGVLRAFGFLNPLRKLLWIFTLQLFNSVVSTLNFGRGEAQKRLLKTLRSLYITQTLFQAQAEEIESDWDAHLGKSLASIREYSNSLGLKITPELQEKSAKDFAVFALAQMKELIQIGQVFMEPDLAIYLIKDRTANALLNVWVATGKAESEFAPFVSSFPGNKTLEMNTEWQELTQTLQRENVKNPKTAAALESRTTEALFQSLNLEMREAIEKFLEANGHCTSTWDVAVPTWGENPLLLLPLLKNSLRNNRTPSKEISDKKQKSTLTFPPEFETHSRSVDKTVKRLQTFMRIDEEHHFWSGILLSPSRVLLKAIGEKFTASGILNSTDQIFFLELKEIETILETWSQSGEITQPTFSFLADNRKSIWKRSFQTTPPYELGASLETSQSAPAEGEVQGVPVSTGISEGTVRWVDSFADCENLPEETILVTASPNPAFTPMYPMVRGIITCTGSQLSHGFIAAREYALPAISQVKNAKHILRDGMQVRMNGSTGTIDILKGPS